LYFILSKSLGTLLLPSNFFFAVGALGILLLIARKASLGIKLLVSSFAALALCAFSPLGYALLLPLESQYPPWSPSPDVQGIIVLGGTLRMDVTIARHEPVSSFAIDRVITAARLARQYPDAKIIFTGGSSNLLDNDAREADYVVQMFENMGIQSDRIVADRSARNTIENVEFVKSQVTGSGKQWLLVTSAFHMPRAMALFRNAGLTPQPVPVGWLTGGKDDLFRFSTGFEGLFRVHVAAREWFGLIAAYLSGQTRTLFPTSSKAS
jgi:uncharacterized SAM-binding protein YcdF (DUF218 family)